MSRWLIVLSLALAACEPAPTARPGVAGAGRVSDAEVRALMEKGRLNAEKNSKLTPRPRRFYGDSL